MANRSCAEAQRHAAGCGYIVVGAEPGAVSGVAEVDPAVLDQGIQAYLGSDGPAWGMNYIRKDASSVLVITVEPPAPGDRIRTLHRDFASYLAGTAFVRRPGRTIQAQPGDIRALEDRFAEPFRQAERDNLRQRLEKVSNAVEDLFWVIQQALASDNPGVLWAEPRNRFADAADRPGGPPAENHGDSEPGNRPAGAVPHPGSARRDRGRTAATRDQLIVRSVTL